MNTTLKITLRRLYRDRLYAVINIAGLSLAFACCLVLALYLHSELTYDLHHVNHPRIFRVVNEFTVNGKVDDFAPTSASLGAMLREAMPEVQDVVRLRRLWNPPMLRHEEQGYFWDDTYLADPNVFQVFTHDVIHGDPATALLEPTSIAVSQTFARRYFGDENPIGRVMQMDGREPRKVTLVFADLPENSHLRYDVLFAYTHEALRVPDNVTARRQSLWGISDYTYLVLPEDYRRDDFTQVSSTFYDEHMKPFELPGWSWRAWLQPLRDIHLYSDVGNDLPVGNRFYVYGFGAVAVFVLLVACINYVNLSTARTVKRAREVGMRKILGARRRYLVTQFLSESLLFATIALVIGVACVELALKLTPLDLLLGKALSANLTQQPLLLAGLAAFALIIGVLSGLYPAIYLSSASPLTALAGGHARGTRGAAFRRVLVLVQFTASIAVIASTLLMAAQLKYVSNKSLGFDQDHRIVITLHGQDLIDQVPVMANELKTNPRVLGVTTATQLMGGEYPTNLMMIESETGTMDSSTMVHTSVENNFIEEMGLELIAGRGLAQRLLTDVGPSFVVNEALVRQLGWDNAIGKKMTLGGNEGRVVGVVRDFHYLSLHNRITPFALYAYFDTLQEIPAAQRPLSTRTMIVHVAGEEIADTLAFIADKFRVFDPVHTFDYEFLDDRMNKLYASEQRLLRLTAIFAGVCIFIACLGLFGLAASTTEQRTREIGIRKVLGASTAQIILLIAKGSLLLVLIGSVIGSALAYSGITQWLENFAYRGTINPLNFLTAAALALLVAYCTVALQCLRTALANPVDSLRYE